MIIRILIKTIDYEFKLPLLMIFMEEFSVTEQIVWENCSNLCIKKALKNKASPCNMFINK